MKAAWERIAAAPISWGVSEVPTWGHQMSPQRVFDEMASLGFLASELGPNGYFANEEKVALELQVGGFSIIAGFVPVTFRFPDGMEDTIEKLHDTLARLSGSGASLAVLAVAGEDSDYESRLHLNETQWDKVADGIEVFRNIASTHGLGTVLHPHYGTLVETISATQEIVDRSDVDLCLDTGHLALVGDDPMELLSRFRERVQHVHLKDVDADLAEQVRNGTISYYDAVKKGLYPPLGGGHVRFDEIIAALETSGYDGWYVLEQDVALSGEPVKGGGPLDDARISIDFLKRLDIRQAIS